MIYSTFSFVFVAESALKPRGEILGEETYGILYHPGAWSNGKFNLVITRAGMFTHSNFNLMVSGILTFADNMN